MTIYPKKKIHRAVQGGLCSTCGGTFLAGDQVVSVNYPTVAVYQHHEGCYGARVEDRKEGVREGTGDGGAQ